MSEDHASTQGLSTRRFNKAQRRDLPLLSGPETMIVWTRIERAPFFGSAFARKAGSFCAFHRGLVAEGTVRAHLVVIDPPRLIFYPTVVKTQEPECVEAFSPDPAVEGRCDSIVRRFAGATEVEDHAVAPGP